MIRRHDKDRLATKSRDKSQKGVAKRGGFSHGLNTDETRIYEDRGSFSSFNPCSIRVSSVAKNYVLSESSACDFCWLKVESFGSKLRHGPRGYPTDACYVQRDIRCKA